MPRGEGLQKTKVDFSSVASMSVGTLFGSEPIPVTEMTKKLWAFVKTYNLMVKPA